MLGVQDADGVVRQHRAVVVDHAQLHAFAADTGGKLWSASVSTGDENRPARFGGGDTLCVLTRGFASTPSSASGISFSSFLRAFMMPGSEA